MTRLLLLLWWWLLLEGGMRSKLMVWGYGGGLVMLSTWGRMI